MHVPPPPPTHTHTLTRTCMHIPPPPHTHAYIQYAQTPPPTHMNACTYPPPPPPPHTHTNTAHTQTHTFTYPTHTLITEATQNLPFLIQSLLGHDRSQHSVIATHIRWLERTLAIQFRRTQLDADTVEEMKRHPHAYQFLWSVSSDIQDGTTGLHTPVPLKPTTFSSTYPVDSLHMRIRVFLTGPLLHLTNLLFPLFSDGAQKRVQRLEVTEALTPTQLAAIHHVNSFIKSRSVHKQIHVLSIITSNNVNSELADTRSLVMCW